MSPSRRVAGLAADADVLVHEVFRTEALRPLMSVAPHLVHIADYHADSTALGAMAARIAVPTLVLTHLIPAPRGEADEVALAEEVRAAGFEGDIVVARDLTTVSF